MISFRLRAKWQNCRGYVPRYERTPKNGWFDIHSVFATHVETVVLLSKEIITAKEHIEITLDSKDLELTKSEIKASYREIQEYIWEKYNKKVHTAYIAEVKKMCGIIERENYNKSKKSPKDYEKSVRHCPQEKVAMIKDAFQHFKMI